MQNAVFAQEKFIRTYFFIILERETFVFTKTSKETALATVKSHVKMCFSHGCGFFYKKPEASSYGKGEKDTEEKDKEERKETPIQLN